MWHLKCKSVLSLNNPENTLSVSTTFGFTLVWKTLHKVHQCLFLLSSTEVWIDMQVTTVGTPSGQLKVIHNSCYEKVKKHKPPNIGLQLWPEQKIYNPKETANWYSLKRYQGCQHAFPCCVNIAIKIKYPHIQASYNSEASQMQTNPLILFGSDQETGLFWQTRTLRSFDVLGSVLSFLYFGTLCW